MTPVVVTPVIPSKLPPKYSFFLADSRDLSNIGELDQARNRQFSIQLNRAGSASFTFPMDDLLADQIEPILSALKIYRKGSDNITKCIWSGSVSAISEDISNNTMSVNCVGWFDRLMHRYTRKKMLWTSTDDKQILLDLLAEANNVAPTSDPYGPYGTPPISLGSVPIPQGSTASNPNTPTWILGGATSPGARVSDPNPINKTIEQDTSFGQAILDLTEIENGCDFSIDPETRVMNVYGKSQLDKTSEAVFGYKWGPSNLQQVSREIDATNMANYLVIRNGVNVPAFTYNLASQLQYGIYEEIQNNSAFLTTETMLYYANAELPFKEYPKTTYSLVPFPFTSGSSVPEPFVSYGLGDIVTFVAKHPPRVDIEQDCRVFGMTVNITEEGNEIFGPLQIYHTG